MILIILCYDEIKMFYYMMHMFNLDYKSYNLYRIYVK
jgi:hypothetical protein